MNINAAVVQLRPRKDLEKNLEAAGQWIDAACEQGARLIVLPENFAYFGLKPLSRLASAEWDGNGPARAFLRQKARETGAWLVGGTVPILDKSVKRPFAASLLISPEGVEIARYNKIHLFDISVEETGKVYRESDDYTPGDAVVAADTPIGKIGLSVCYDLRFPELYRRMVSEGASILVAPSAFTAVTGEAHWQLLLRSRAVENLCFVLGANLVGREDDKNPTWGGSAIIDPWGSVLARLDDQEGVAVAELDFEKQQRIRANLPALEHRRIFDL